MASYMNRHLKLSAREQSSVQTQTTPSVEIHLTRRHQTIHVSSNGNRTLTEDEVESPLMKKFDLPLGVLASPSVRKRHLLDMLRSFDIDDRGTLDSLVEKMEAFAVGMSERLGDEKVFVMVAKVEIVTIEQKEGGRVCGVCLEDLWDKNELIGLVCSHTFHRNCILRWFAERNSCPLCRRRIYCDF